MMINWIFTFDIDPIPCCNTLKTKTKPIVFVHIDVFLRSYFQLSKIIMHFNFAMPFSFDFYLLIIMRTEYYISHMNKHKTDGSLLTIKITLVCNGLFAIWVVFTYSRFVLEFALFYILKGNVHLNKVDKRPKRREWCRRLYDVIFDTALFYIIFKIPLHRRLLWWAY
jgi:hypothetical protein